MEVALRIHVTNAPCPRASWYTVCTLVPLVWYYLPALTGTDAWNSHSLPNVCFAHTQKFRVYLSIHSTEARESNMKLGLCGRCWALTASIQGDKTFSACLRGKTEDPIEENHKNWLHDAHKSSFNRIRSKSVATRRNYVCPHTCIPELQPSLPTSTSALHTQSPSVHCKSNCVFDSGATVAANAMLIHLGHVKDTLQSKMLSLDSEQQYLR